METYMYFPTVYLRNRMSLTDLIAGVEAHEKRLTVFNADPGVAESLREYFVDRNLAVVEADVDDAPANFAVLGERGAFLAACDVADLLAQQEETRLDFEEAAFRPVLDELDETMFTSFDPDRMLAASREIEDRAWRVGDGELHSGFQSTDVFERRREAYERLGGRESLSVHAYAAPEVGGGVDAGGRPAVENVRFHLADTDELRSTWFVAFDGAGVDRNKCALVAEEREERSFYGFWTYSASTVDYVLSHLDAAYGSDDRVDDPGSSAPGPSP